MARIPRKLAGIGAPDLLSATAFDTYIGPAREITVDQQRGIIALHDGATPGGQQFHVVGDSVARDFANKWTTEAEGVLVDDGVNAPNYSAYHWAQVALEAATSELPDNPVSTNNIVDGAVTSQKLTADLRSQLANETPNGRLTLTSGVAVTTADVAGAPTVYYVPVDGTKVPLFNGTEISLVSIGTGLSLTLASNAAYAGYHVSGRNFDLFVFNDSGTIRLGTGPSWLAGAAGSSVARGTGAGSTDIQRLGAIWVNTNSIVLRFGSGSSDTVLVPAQQATYVGTIRTTANGQVDDTITKRFVYNAYNQAERKLLRGDPTASWTYSVTAWRQVRGDVDNRIEVVAGLAGAWIDLHISARASSSTSSQKGIATGIGLDQTTINAADIAVPASVSNTLFGHPYAKLQDQVPLGYHAYNMLEFGGGTDVQTFAGNDSSARLVGNVIQ